VLFLLDAAVTHAVDLAAAAGERYVPPERAHDRSYGSRFTQRLRHRLLVQVDADP